jgi:hypothetical protein
MGRAKQKHWLRRPKMPPMPEVVWNVAGIDQHGESISFDVTDCMGAYEHAARFERLGGSVRVRRMVWSGPAAAYRLPREEK